MSRPKCYQIHTSKGGTSAKMIQEKQGALILALLVSDSYAVLYAPAPFVTFFSTAYTVGEIISTVGLSAAPAS